MRLSLLGVSAALAMGLALSACNSSTVSSGSTLGSQASVQTGGAQVTIMHNGHKFLIRPAAGVKVLTAPQCQYSKYSFCFYVEKGNKGPYVTTSDGSSPLYMAAVINNNKNGKKDKKFKTYFYPDPGDPSSQYIIYKGKNVKADGPVKFTDVYCIGYSQNSCANNTDESTLYLGIALAPGT